MAEIPVSALPLRNIVLPEDEVPLVAGGANYRATAAAIAALVPIDALQAQLDAIETRTAAIEDTVSSTIPAALIIISHGQSLGRRQPPAVTAGVTIANYFMPQGGQDPTDFPNHTGNDDGQQKISNYDTFVPFQENPATGEGWGSGLGYQFRQNVLGNGKMIFFAPARGAGDWRALRPGTGVWANLVMYVYRAYEHFYAQGELNIQPRLVWTQIEADCDTVAPGGGTSEAVISAAQAKDLQEEVLRHYQRAMTMMFGRDMYHLPMYMTPLNSAHYDDVTLASPHPKAGAASRYAQAGQLAAAKANPKIILLPPHGQVYAHMATDGIHLGGGGRRLHAELCATVIERVEGGTAYMAPHVLSATRSGAVVTALCHFPGGGGGVRDTTTFADPGTTNWPDQKYGVQFWDNTTAAFINVSDATISGSTMTVTLAATPAGAGQLRIGQLPWTTSTLGATTWTARTNFRDATLSVTAEDTTVLYHYMIPQSIAVA